ncbi:SpoIIE family protein phosphatase [Streptantibioticus ferralitis]|uniref:SpoIIE family protein phosphatase n=1 Tax=Streptantibioticus ferralitis TaxID=236510 RepID=A0ABT5YW82_9ACTN|nr:SpoIIE family protein phosphatase [Streptantibioticus ferralitis]MDF2255105.1 SpoIIE family protein phosphatase [Streptantibioticus ferralitis]
MKRHSISYRRQSPGGSGRTIPRAASPGSVRATLALNGMGSFEWDLDAEAFILDAGGLAVMGLRAGEYDGRTRTLGRRILPDDLPGLEAAIGRALASHPSYGGYFRVRHPDGTVRWTHVQGRILRDASGRARRVVGIVRDASEELQHFAEQTALRVDRQRQADVVQGLTYALSQALSVEDVTMAVTSEETRRRIGATAIALGIVEQGHTRVVGAAGLPEGLVRDMSVSRLNAATPFAEAVRSRTPRFLSRHELRDRYPRMWPYLKATAFTRAAILPLVAQAQPNGALAIAFQDRPGFTSGERNLLLALSSTIAQSLQRSVLYDHEHELAVGLQHAMLPARIPDCLGARIAVRYRPSQRGREIGGDWYDVISLAANRIGIVVGDVEGHDVHAAAIMGQLRIVLRAYAAEGHSPSTVIARVSAFLRDLDTERFATCIYADLDTATGNASIVRAGHLGPLVRRADGTCGRPPVPGGPPLGLLDNADTSPYPTVPLQMRPWDMLLLCTDGLVEFHGMDLDEGVQQLETVVLDGPSSLEDLADHIIDTIEARSELLDDAALLLAELGSPGQGLTGRLPNC